MIVTMLNPSCHSSTSYSYSDPLNPVHRNGLHQHAYFELIYVIDGSMYQNIENKRHLYSKGSLCLLNRNIHHAEEFTTDFRAAFLSLPVALVDELFNHTDQFYFSEENFRLSRQTLDLQAYSQVSPLNLLPIYYDCGQSFDMPRNLASTEPQKQVQPPDCTAHQSWTNKLEKIE